MTADLEVHTRRLTRRSQCRVKRRVSNLSAIRISNPDNVSPMQSSKSKSADERFSVGVSIRSKRLTVADLGDVVKLFGNEWKASTAKELRPPLRSGVEGELGAYVHSHLRDYDPGKASANVLTAATLLTSEFVARLRSQDPDLELDIHVEQHLPDRGRVQPVLLTVDAVHMLAVEMGQRNVGLDIDQYGADGFAAINAMLNPFLSKRKVPAEVLRFVVEFWASNGQIKRVEQAVSDPYDLALPITQLAETMSAFPREERIDAAVIAGHFTLEQDLPIYNPVGPSLWLDPALLLLLDRHHCDLTIRTRIGPALLLRRGRTSPNDVVAPL